MEDRILQCTILFVDIADSTTLWKKHHTAFKPAHDECMALAKKHAQKHLGRIVKSTGDGLLILFDRASDAAYFGINQMKSVGETNWSRLVPGLDNLELHIGVGSGWALESETPGNHLDYFGFAPNKASRIESASNGGQIVVCNITRGLIEQDHLPDFWLKPLGSYKLAGCGAEPLWQLCANGLRDQFPTLRAEAEDAGNLPALTSTPIDQMGRRETLVKLISDSQERIISIVGLPGSGKSLFLLAASHDLAGKHADGIYWADMDGVSTETELIERILSELGLPPSAGPESILLFFAEKSALLILDALLSLDSASFIQKLIRKCPKLKLVRTGFIALFGGEERVKSLEPLTVDESVELLQREAAYQDMGGVVEADLESAKSLCMLLDGNALAIRLAANLLITRTLPEAVARIRESIGELTAEGLNTKDRQASLEGAIQSVLASLPHPTRLAFEAASVFESRFSAEDLEFILPEGRREVLRMKQAGLLRSESGSTQFLQFAVPYGVRRVGLQVLRSGTGFGEFRDRHAKWVATQLHSAVATGRTPEESLTRDMLRLRVADLESAFEWAVNEWPGRRDTDALLIAADLAAIYNRHGLAGQAKAVIDRVRNTDLILGPEPAISLAREETSALIDLGKAAEAKSAARKGLLLVEDIVDASSGEYLASELRSLLGIIEGRYGDPELARDYYASALRGFEQGRYAVRQAMVLNNLGNLELHKFKNPGRAKAYLQRALELFEAVGDKRGIAETSNNLGLVAFDEKDFKLAKQYEVKALTLAAELCIVSGAALAAYNLAETAVALGENQPAAVLYLTSNRLFESVGSPYAHDALERLSSMNTFDQASAKNFVSTQSILDITLGIALELEAQISPPVTAVVQSGVQTNGELTDPR